MQSPQTPRTTSVAVTRGVRVAVRSQYLPSRSNPAQRHYAFAYTIRITNEGEATVQLLTRHWIITHADGHVEEVRGPGVVGHQPVLRRGESFEYTSGCVLRTTRGTMQGSYQMVDEHGQQFDAQIAEFSLEMPHSLN
ncbi:MAG: Co2+/Mg2+ efflux protein ApaG [Myxococcota bacterium]|nr:Co2+/Mg2+ efflux protein ApaG [Myxococcota bacterium]MDW8364014.1 Co2+/Mg2+ efflux protein ApaG [Myxococcales bacterium]